MLGNCAREKTYGLQNYWSSNAEEKYDIGNIISQLARFPQTLNKIIIINGEQIIIPWETSNAVLILIFVPQKTFFFFNIGTEGKHLMCKIYQSLVIMKGEM